MALEVKIIWGDAYIEAAVQLSLSACLSLFALLSGKLKGTQRGSQTAGPLVWLTAWSEPASLSTVGPLSRVGSGVCLCHLSGSCGCPWVNLKLEWRTVMVMGCWMLNVDAWGEGECTTWLSGWGLSRAQNRNNLTGWLADMAATQMLTLILNTP